MKEDLPQRLRRLRELTGAVLDAEEGTFVPELAAAAERAAAHLDRDLLPRTAGADTYLVVGLVGPNNAGKSALFNGLVGRELSPSVPTGGATRRLLGALHPELARKLAGEPTLARFPLERLGPARGPASVVLEQGDDAARLFLVELEELPEGILLIDTPDFDSILTDNRRASESLLQVADLAVVVVTRHTYQNRDVVTFLREWLEHGRPWMLVYNESISPEVTRQHAQKLGEDLGSPPLAIFHAPFDLGVQQGSERLVPLALDPDDGGGGGGGLALDRWLFALGRAPELKHRALEASLGQLRVELWELVRALSGEGRLSGELAERARARTHALAREVAGGAMPMGPFLEAFRAVLDRRPSLLQRGLRGVLRRGRLLLEGALRRLSLAAPRRPGREPEAQLVAVERRVLRALWAPYFEQLVLDLAPGGSFWREGEERRAPDPLLEERLAADLDPHAGEAARERASAAIGEDPEVLRAFEEACEELIERELDERGGEWMFQIAVDVVHLLPFVAAGLVIVQTGGLGADIAVAGAGAVSSFVAERLSRLLGTELARHARRRWTELRSERMAARILGAVLPRTAPVLATRTRSSDELSARLRAELEELP